MTAQFSPDAFVADSETLTIQSGVPVTKLIVIDSTIDDKAAFYKELAPGTAVVEIDGEDGVLAGLDAALAGYSNLQALHIVSHGSAGELVIAGETFNSETIKALLPAIDAAMADGGDLLLYGCNIGAGEAGKAFLDIIAAGARVDVAASDDTTGAAAKGGDWDLEVKTGTVETGVPFSAAALADFTDVLAGPVTFDFNGTSGGLGGGSNTNATTTSGGYTLVLDGQIFGTQVAFGQGYAQLGETQLTLSLQGGNVFTATSLWVSNIYAGTATITVTSDVGGDSAQVTLGNGGNSTLDLTGFDNVTKLYVTTTAATAYIGVDDLVMSSITPLNTNPTLTATGVNPGFTEGGSAADLFSGVTADSEDVGQALTGFTFTVTNLADGASEIVTVGGTDIVLTNGTAGTTAGANYSVSVVGSTATVTLSGGSLDTAGMSSLIDGMSYKNTSDNPSTGSSRVVTITHIADDGGANVAPAAPVSSTVALTPVNDDPSATGLATDVTVTEDTASNLNLSAITLSDADSGGSSITLTLAASAGTLAASSGGSVTVGGSGTGTLTLTGTVANLNTYLDTASNIQYTGAANVYGNNAATLTVTANDGGNTGSGGGGDVVLGTVNLDISAVNDDPSATGVPSDVTVVEETASDLDLSAITLADVDSGGNSITLTLAASGGTMAASSGGGVTIGGSGTDTITLAGTVADINTYLDTASNIQYTGDPNVSGNDAATLTITANDGGNVGSGGGGNVALGTVNIDITAANAAPVFAGLDGTPSFTEGGSAVTLDADVTVSDLELDGADDYSGAVLTIERNGSADTDDSITISDSGASFTAAGGFLTASGHSFATYTSANGTLTITFTDGGTAPSAALVDEVMQHIVYSNTSDAPDASVQLDWTFDDGIDTATGSTTVSVTGVNDDPSGANAPASFAVLEDTATALDLSGMSFSDPDSASVTVTVSAGAGTIGMANPAPDNLVGTGNGSGTITLTGAIADIETYLSTPTNLAYTPAANVNGNAATSISVTISDGGAGGEIAVGTFDVNITAVNDAPVVGNLDGDDASQVIAGAGATLVSDLADVTVTDIDSTDFNGGYLQIVRLSGTSNGIWGVDGTRVTSGGDATIAGLDKIFVDGVEIGEVDNNSYGQGNALLIWFRNSDATSANIQTLIQNLTFSAASGLGERLFLLSVLDGDDTANGGVDSTSVSFTINVTPNPPVIANLDGDSVSFTEGDTGVLLDAGSNATLTDVDSTDFDGGNVTVSYVSGQASEDRIVIDTTGTVTLSAGMTAGSVVSVGGTAIGEIEVGETGGANEDLVITLNSDATPTLVQALIRALHYNNAGGDDPIIGDRVIRVSVTDAGASAATGSADVTVSVAGVNDNPAVANLPTDVTVTEDTASDLDLSALTLTDADSGNDNITLTLTASAGTMAASSSGNVTVGGSGTGTLTLAGEADDIDAWLDTAANIQYTGALNAAGNDAATLTLTANDGGNNGSGGGSNVALGTVNIDITGVNDLPTSTGGSVNAVNGQAKAFAAADFNFADVDAGDALASVRIDTLPATGVLKLGAVDVTPGQVIAVGDLATLTYTGAGTGNHSFTFSVNDGSGFAAAPATMTLAVAAATVNTAPASPTLSANVVQENAKGAVIGMVSATDAEGGALTFSVEDGRFEIVNGLLKLKAGVSLDYETDALVPIVLTIKVADEGGLESSSQFALTVIDVPEAVLPDTGGTYQGMIVSEYVTGLGGNDIIFVDDGDDTVFGGAGNDSIDGGLGRDILYGGLGDDTVSGDAGNDTIWGGLGDTGNDTVSGGSGNDRLGGAGGNDDLEGGEGSDIVYGSAGDDTVIGGAGGDLLFGGAGDDMLLGEVGDDTLWGGAGNDTLTGGEGADTYVFGNLGGNTVITDFSVAEDTLHLTGTLNEIHSRGDLVDAAVAAGSNVTIDLGGGRSITLTGVSLADLEDIDLIMDN